MNFYPALFGTLLAISMFVPIKCGHEIENIGIQSLPSTSQNDGKSGKEMANFARAKNAGKEELKNLEELFALTDLVEATIHTMMLPYGKRLVPERVAKMEAEFRTKPHLLQNNFQRATFEDLAYSGEACGEIKIAAYNLTKHSPMFGVYHIGVHVCMIEIHFHRPGIEFWLPQNYHTKFVGGHYRELNTIKYAKARNKKVETKMSFFQIVDLIERNFKEKYAAHTYNLLRHNCLDFSKEFIGQIADKEPGDSIEFPMSAIFPPEKPLTLIARSVREGGRALGRSASASARLGRSWSKSFVGIGGGSSAGGRWGIGTSFSRIGHPQPFDGTDESMIEEKGEKEEVEENAVERAKSANIGKKGKEEAEKDE